MPVSAEPGSPQGQLDAERRSPLRRRVDADVSAHPLHHAAHQPEPEAQASVMALLDGALEALEDARLMFDGNAWPLIAHAEPDRGSRGPELDHDRLARSELEGILQQVSDDLRQVVAVP